MRMRTSAPRRRSKSPRSPAKRAASTTSTKATAKPAKPAKSKLAKMATRIASGVVMAAVLVGVIRRGHFAVAVTIAAIQTGIFCELVSLRYVEAKERQVPLFRTLQYGWFAAAMLHSYGSAWLKAPVGGGAVARAANAVVPIEAAAVVLFSGLLVLTVLSLKPGLYGYQVKQLSWTLMSITIAVVMLKCAVFLVHAGLFWFLFPASLVVANDTFAYFSGVAFGRRLFPRATFLALSPNKTWEGFLGAFVLTVAYSWYGAAWWARSAFLRCSYPEVAAAAAAAASAGGGGAAALDALLPMGRCANDHLFAPDGGVAPIALGLGVFASSVAPFGGFLASAIKRGFKVKDFAGWIPGHGGFTDRMDCQLVMSVAAYVVFTTFVRSPLALTFDQVLNAARLLSADERSALVSALQTAA